jgi:predicted transcriptional regulator
MFAAVKKGEWTLLSNHGRVLNYLAHHQCCTIQLLAQETGLSVAAVQKILKTLDADGYISRTRNGRSNKYLVNLEMPLRHRLEHHHVVGELVSALGGPHK